MTKNYGFGVVYSSRIGPPQLRAVRSFFSPPLVTPGASFPLRGGFVVLRRSIEELIR